MKYAIVVLTALITFNACRSKVQPIVSEAFADSLISQYTTPTAIKNNQADLDFWRSRISTNSPDYTNNIKYAAALVARFKLLGKI